MISVSVSDMGLCEFMGILHDDFEVRYLCHSSSRRDNVRVDGVYSGSVESVMRDLSWSTGVPVNYDESARLWRVGGSSSLVAIDSRGVDADLAEQLDGFVAGDYFVLPGESSAAMSELVDDVSRLQVSTFEIRLLRVRSTDGRALGIEFELAYEASYWGADSKLAVGRLVLDESAIQVESKFETRLRVVSGHPYSVNLGQNRTRILSSASEAGVFDSKTVVETSGLVVGFQLSASGEFWQGDLEIEDTSETDSFVREGFSFSGSVRLNCGEIEAISLGDRSETSESKGLPFLSWLSRSKSSSSVGYVVILKRVCP